MCVRDTDDFFLDFIGFRKEAVENFNPYKFIRECVFRHGIKNE